MESQDSRKKLNEMIKGIDFAMLTTALEDGSLRSRPMATQRADFDGTLWFFTRLDAPKVHEIRQHQKVNLSYAKPDSGRYVSVSGLAEISRDREKMKQLWNPVYKDWFPKGPEDPEVGLLKVDVTNAEYWDGPASRMVQLSGFLKAASGKPKK